MPESSDENDATLIRAKINAETAKIPWKELQRFFAAGKTLFVDSKLDLVDVACAFQQDDSNLVEQWLNRLQVVAVSSEQARGWLEKDSLVWAVVVKPWVLVQIREN